MRGGARFTGEPVTRRLAAPPASEMTRRPPTRSPSTGCRSPCRPARSASYELLTVGGADTDPAALRETVNANAPVLKPSMTLRQALALMLQSDARVGVVLDDERYLGVLTLAKIGKMIRRDA